MAGVIGRGEEKEVREDNRLKKELRAKIQAELKQMPSEARQAGSRQICERLEQQSIWRKAESILFYAPHTGEPDIWRLVEDSLAAGKTVALPRFVETENRYSSCLIREIGRDVEIGRYGIREPGKACPTISLKRLDLILVPGVAFDLDGWRLGRGKGYYDQLLANLEGPTCGVAFDQQIVSQIPVELHDVRLSCILTPSRWHEVAGSRAVLK